MSLSVGAAKKKRSLAAKQKSTEHANANLIQDEEEAFFSEPDPVSTVGLASSLTSQTSLEQLKEVTKLYLWDSHMGSHMTASPNSYAPSS